MLLLLSDGRRLCFTEYGNPEGRPVIAFHGNPNSRLIWGIMPEDLERLGLRLIAPDRPGYGGTDFKKDTTTLENWPNDVIELAGHLNLETFAVFGASGGGPYSLACAWKIPERLTCAGVFAGVGPRNSETENGLRKQIRAMFRFAPKVPGLFMLQMRLFSWLAIHHPKTYLNLTLKEFGPHDRAVYDRLNLAELLAPNRQEVYKQCGIGSWYDAMIPAHWPIPLEEIETKVYLWQGTEDASVSLAMGKYLAGKIPDCEAEFMEGAGHLWIFEHFDEILRILLAGN